MNQLDIKLQSGSLQLNVHESEYKLEELCGFAARQNSKRGFLFVSKVLGKHYPVKPKKMREIYSNLAQKIQPLINQKEVLFLGFAETATGLGAGIFEEWHKTQSMSKAAYLQTTRYFFEQEILLNFQEEHSHATGHLLYSNLPNTFFTNLKTIVLIDDELTTGTTNYNFLNEFIKKFNCKLEKIIIVSIKNWMSIEHTNKFIKHFQCPVEFISILNGQFKFTKDEFFTVGSTPQLDGNKEVKSSIIANNPLRFGFHNDITLDFNKIIHQEKIDLNKKTLVLGTGEFSYFPFLLAEFLETNRVDVCYQSTTRSPILIGHDIQHKITFQDNYQDGIENYVYNVQPEQYEQVLICYETKEKFDCKLDEILNAKNIFMEHYL